MNEAQANTRTVQGPVPPPPRSLRERLMGVLVGVGVAHDRVSVLQVALTGESPSPALPNTTGGPRAMEATLEDLECAVGELVARLMALGERW